MKNKIYSATDVRIFQGSFPVETINQTLKTKVEAGDVIALDNSKNFGKYDGTTYTNVYGTIEEPGEVTVILTGGLIKDFVKFNNKEKELTIELRKLGIFIK